MEKTIEEISRQIGRIFRYLLPGILILLMARWSHPSWFCEYDFLDGENLIVFAALAVVVGNVWYVAHRYSIHQLLDLCFSRRYRRPKETKGSKQIYRDWLAEHLDGSFALREKRQELAEHLWNRSSQVIFLWIVAEAALAFALCPAPGSSFARHRCSIILAAIIAMVVAGWNTWISHGLDVRLGKRAPTKDPDPPAGQTATSAGGGEGAGSASGRSA
jgi:hypothetical protein